MHELLLLSLPENDAEDAADRLKVKWASIQLEIATVGKPNRDAVALGILKEQLARPDVARCLDQIGCELHAVGCYAEGLVAVQQALSIRRRLLGEESVETAQSLANVGATLHNLGRHVEALEHAEQALAIRQLLLGDKSVDTAVSLANIGVMQVCFPQPSSGRGLTSGSPSPRTGS